MPQLAPLNWIFLELFFWMGVILITIMFWWNKDKKYYINKSYNNGEKLKMSWKW